MSKQTHIFATRSDLEAGLNRIEKTLKIKYARCDLYHGPVIEQFLSLLEWKDLGRNFTGDHISGPRFLVVPVDQKVNIEKVPQHDTGEDRFNVSQKLNRGSITFMPGGLHDKHRALVCGHIGTVDESPEAKALYRAFVRAITAGFERIGSYLVGPEAVKLMDEGWRMVTISLGSPIAYDLRRPIN